MDAVAVTVSSSPVPSALGTQAAQGAFWTLLCSALNKAITAISQIALAWLLLPREVGLVAVAFSITSLASALSSSHLVKVLIPAKERFEQQAGQVFWLSLALNSIAAALLAAVSPLAGACFKEPNVTSLILVVAAAIPIMALPLIYTARLYRDLRFRTVALIHFCIGLVQNGGAVALAWIGFGPYSLVLPLLLAGVTSAVMSRCLAGRIPLNRPNPRQWLVLLAPAMWLMLQMVLVAVQTHGPGSVIAFLHGPAAAGIYSWGLLISSQAVFLFAFNMQNVLLPALSRLNDDASRQHEALLKSCKTLTVLVVPICLLQFFLADVLIGILFNAHWRPAVPVVQWLSLGQLAQPLAIVGSALLLAHREYALLAAVTTFGAAVSILAALFGSIFGAESSIAAWTAGAALIGNLVVGYTALKRSQRKTFKPASENTVLGFLAMPFAFALPGVIAGFLIKDVVPTSEPATLIAAVALALIGGYLLLTRISFPALSREVMAKLLPNLAMQKLPEAQAR